MTLFTPIFPAKQKEIRAGEEKEAFPTRLCPSNTGRWTLIFGFQNKPFLPAFGLAQTSITAAFHIGMKKTESRSRAKVDIFYP
jgi:hypothetical protein